jgi:hypothetical protein
MRGRPRPSRIHTAVGSVSAALLSFALLSCSDTNLATPPPSHGPIFQMVVVGPVACGEGVIATACLTVRITNLGDTAGDGSCRLIAAGTLGGFFPVSGIAPGATLTTTALWNDQLPFPPIFSGGCEPGLRT